MSEKKSNKKLILDSISTPNDIKKLSDADLTVLATELRDEIITTVSKTGGHLAPSLGVVELTIALLRSLDLPNDKIVWDVGHQSYAYKILTGRRERFSTLRQYKGISGFCAPTESEYDTAISGHTSTSVSVGLGIKMGNEIAGKESKTVAVIGDGALGGGLAFEGLNNAGSLKKNLIIVLNDNEMSIDKNVGAFSTYLSKSLSGEFVTKFKQDLKHMLEDAPLGDKFIKFIKKIEASLVSFFIPGTIFENLGIKYIGPINGHKIADIEQALSNACLQVKPVIIHVITQKGRGYLPAENKPDIYHGVSSFNVETGELNGSSSNNESWSDCFGRNLCTLAKEDSRVVAITAAMKDGTGLRGFSNLYADRFFDVGIAEQHAVAFSAGLATFGMRPFFAVYSTFLQRAYDQIIHDVAISNLPVTFCIDRSGLVGADGPTHHGVFDLTFLRAIPNIIVMLPKDSFELEQMLKLSLSLNSPVAIRYPRGNVNIYPELTNQEVELGVPEIVFKGNGIAIISNGYMFDEAYKVYKMLLEKGHSISLINVRFLKPFEAKTFVDELKDKTLIITIEENIISGGLGEMVQSVLQEAKLFIPVEKFGLNCFVEQGDIKSLRDDYDLTADKIFKKISKLL